MMLILSAISLWCKAYRHQNTYYGFLFGRMVSQFFSGDMGHGVRENSDEWWRGGGVQNKLFLQWGHYWMAPNTDRLVQRDFMKNQTDKIKITL